MESPKVFISHATKDQERFVEDFAQKLLNKGIEVWYSNWSLLPGDSLVKKISNEGISESDCVIIVISKNSDESNWVKKELDWSVNDSINSMCKIIPIVIDSNANIPKTLRGIYYKTIENLDDYEEEFNDILHAIYNVPKEQKLGKQPDFVSTISFQGLDKDETIILKTLGDYYINQEFCRPMSYDDLKNLLQSSDLSNEAIIDSLDVLKSKYYVKVEKYHDGTSNPSFVNLTYFGFINYLKNINQFEETEKLVLDLIFNENLIDNKEISERLNIKTSIVNAFFEYYKSRGFFDIQKYLGGSIHVTKVNGKGRKYFKNLN